MKFLHLSDLHLGRRISEYSMLEDQDHILKEIFKIADKEMPDGIIIAGDVYDKSVPSAEAVQLFDTFLNSLAKRKFRTFIISGNHDSAERLSFGSQLMVSSGIHIAKVYDGETLPIEMEDGHGKVNVYLLPFVKPIHVRQHTDEEVATYNDALRIAVEKMKIDTEARNVLVTHQFVTGATRSDSEEISVGGTDNVDASVFEAFDYVALGHIHGGQNCGSEKIRYCGTPLKYSFSEVHHTKSVTVAELGKKGELEVRTVPLVPLRDMCEIRGKYDELMKKSYWENTGYTDDYMRIILTDEEEIPNVMNKLRTVYKNLMRIDYDNMRTRSRGILGVATDVEKKSPYQLFAEFFEEQNGKAMSEEQSKYIAELIEKVWEEDV